MFRREKEKANLSGDFTYRYFYFSGDLPIPKIPVNEPVRGRLHGSDMVFDLRSDPQQEHPMDDQVVHRRLCKEMVRMMRASDAPEEQYLRLGLTDYL